MGVVGGPTSFSIFKKKKMFEKGMFKLKQNITEQNSAKWEKEHKQIKEKNVFFIRSKV